MNHLRTARAETIRTAIDGVAARVTALGLSSWQFELLNGAPHVVTARADDNWLLLAADLGGGDVKPESLWSALAQNASLPGFAKVALRDNGPVQLCAEIPLHDDDNLPDALPLRLREACGGFASAWANTDPHPAVVIVPPAEGEKTIDLKRLSSDAGWPFTERGAGKLAVDLEVPDGYHQALLIPAGCGIRVQSDLATLDNLPDECHRAIGGFLLAASGLVRLVRAAVSAGEGRPVARFEVVFSTPPSPFEISSALESLSVGCSLCGEEIKTLQEPAVARSYLALRGWGSGQARRPERSTA